MFRKLAIAMVFLAMASAASAEAPKERGVFVGLAGGSAVFDDDGAIGYYDDTDTAVQGYIGYKFFRHFGIEARLVNFGSYSDGFDSLDLSSVSAHVVGYIPFGNSGWELSGQIGYAQIDQEVTGWYSESELAGSAGIAIRWHITPSFAIGAQVDAYVWENSDIGSGYDLSVATNLLSIQFNF